MREPRQTTFYLELDSEHPEAGDWAATIANLRFGYGDNVTYEVSGVSLQFKRNEATLCRCVVEGAVAVPSTPADLDEFVSSNPAWTLTAAELYDYVLDSNERRRPYRGDYAGTGEFELCSGKVYIDAKSGQAALWIMGPPEQFGEFYSAILMRRIKPTTWYEPKPRWIKPTWLSWLIGRRG